MRQIESRAALDSNVRPELMQREIQAIKGLDVCPVHIREELTKIPKDQLLDRINEYSLSEQLDNRFYDYRLMELVTCVFGNSWVFDKESFAITEYAKKYLTGIKDMSGGTYGSVVLTAVGGSPLSFIVKTERNVNSSNDAIHEAFVGLIALNRLRAICPNFAVIYGVFMCGIPFQGNLTICDIKNVDVPYLVYENIKGPTLKGLVLKQKYEITDVVSIWLQMIMALKLANAVFRFAHNDLHSSNIVLRKLKSPMYIPYQWSGKGYYVRTRYVATAIDYGKSQVTIKSEGDRGITYFWRRSTGNIYVNPTRGQNMHGHVLDIHKMIAFTTHYSSSNKLYPVEDNPFNTMISIYRLLFKPHLSDLEAGQWIMNDGLEGYYRLDKDPTLIRDLRSGAVDLSNVDNIIQKITSVIGQRAMDRVVTYNDPGKDLLFCSNQTCSDPCETLKGLTLRDPHGNTAFLQDKPELLPLHHRRKVMSARHFSSSPSYSQTVYEDLHTSVQIADVSYKEQIFKEMVVLLQKVNTFTSNSKKRIIIPKVLNKRFTGMWILRVNGFIDRIADMKMAIVYRNALVSLKDERGGNELKAVLRRFIALHKFFLTEIDRVWEIVKGRNPNEVKMFHQRVYIGVPRNITFEPIS